MRLRLPDGTRLAVEEDFVVLWAKATPPDAADKTAAAAPTAR
jgi:hypothetical protein